MGQWRQETGTSLGGENTAQFQATCCITVAVDLQMSTSAKSVGKYKHL